MQCWKIGIYATEIVRLLKAASMDISNECSHSISDLKIQVIMLGQNGAQISSRREKLELEEVLLTIHIGF